MKIALDATYSLDREPSGVAVYSREILHGLPAAHPEASYLFCYRPHRFLGALRETLPPAARRRLLWRGWGARPASLFHALNQRLDSTRYRRAVVTFHDLFVMTAAYSDREFRSRFTQRAKDAARRADLLIAVSRFTAGQLESLLGVEPSRIRVIHHGVHVPRDTPSLASRERLILFTGAIQRRKNVARLVEAFESTAPGWRMVLAGAKGFGADEILDRIARSPRRADIDVAGYVDAATLAGLYGRASVFAFPSLDEGFGMPVLEAMAWGVPVIASNRSALPEVAGGAALQVDPEDAAQLREALATLTADASLRAELARKGRARCAEFTWESAVEKTWQVYGELLAGG